MNKSVTYSYIALSVITAISGGLLCAAAGTGQLVGTDSGTTSFRSPTNVPGIEVDGTSNALKAQAEVEKTGDGLVLQKLEASLPVRSLATGMKTRDEHMRKYIFTTPAGQEPDLYFTAAGASCPPAPSAQGFACQVSGSLSIRGVARPFAINIKVREQSGSAFRVAGDGVVKLSEYGIPAPTQFGVKPVDQVQIHLDFTGRKADVKNDQGGGL